LDTDWLVGKGWSLFANVSGSMVNGNFLIKQRSEPTVNSLGSDIGNIDIQRHMHQNMPNLEMAFGLSWKQHFLNNKYQISLQGAYEFIEWFDQLNLRKFISPNALYLNDTISRGNLTMNGFSLRLQLDM